MFDTLFRLIIITNSKKAITGKKYHGGRVEIKNAE